MGTMVVYLHLLASGQFEDAKRFLESSYATKSRLRSRRRGARLDSSRRVAPVLH